jgi:hypothetical protein
MFASSQSGYRRCRNIIALTFLCAIVFNQTQSVRALEAFVLSPETESIDLTSISDVYTFPQRGDMDRRLQLSSAPGSDGVVKRFEVSADPSNTSPSWIVFALTNESPELLDRLLVMPHFVRSKIFSFWRKPIATRIVSLTSTNEFNPQREKAKNAEVFRITLSPYTTVTFVIEIMNIDSPEVFFWKPEAFQNGAFASARTERSNVSSSNNDLDFQTQKNGAKITFKLVNTLGGPALDRAKFTITTKDGMFIRTLSGLFPSASIPSGDYIIIAERAGESYQALISVEPGADKEFELIAQNGERQSLKPERWTQISRSNEDSSKTKQLLIKLPQRMTLGDVLQPYVPLKGMGQIISMLGSSLKFDSDRVIKVELDNIDKNSEQIIVLRLSILNSMEADPQTMVAQADDGSYVIVLNANVNALTHNKKLSPKIRSSSDVVSAQSLIPSPQGGEITNKSSSNSYSTDYSSSYTVGPFGFFWGASPEKAPAPPIRRLDLSSNNTSDRSGRYCAKQIPEQFITSSPRWKLTYDALKPDKSIAYGLSRNTAGFDLSMNGTIEAYIHKIEILGKEMEVCAVYLKKSLFQISIEGFQYNTEQFSLIRSNLVKRYGEGNSACGSYVCFSTWNDERSQVHISYVTAGGLDYIFAPIKLTYIRDWIDFYKKSFEKRSLGTRF